MNNKDKQIRPEKVSNKSAAEFFSEHQQIAGFDNPGKSLYTTVRELVENSLDAAVVITEYTEEEHNLVHGIIRGDEKSNEINDLKGKNKVKELMYYDIQCIDNGSGINISQIGNMLGKVLSGSKHGLRQTRGKFGLGAKMALIWSKKSSGLPIKIITGYSIDKDKLPVTISSITLDMDIEKNEPKIISSTTQSNSTQNYRGLDIMVTICGNWSNYKSRVLQYFQQLAVITPYAKLSLSFECSRDSNKNFNVTFDRRSEQMPHIPTVMKPHPKGLNHITLSRLIQNSSCSNIIQFLTSELYGFTPKTASQLVTGMNLESTQLKHLSSSHIAALCQVLRDDQHIKAPSANCLSPAGEYNLRLGVLKELQPKLIATFTEKPGSYEGHPFIVEAAVSIGGKNVREGVNIFRYANRIPLLFETGADVVTQVATKKIKWENYLIDSKTDSIGVYVSIVSTKIPFKGTSKEYVGEDVLEIQYSVKRALLGCCQQLKIQLAASHAKKDALEKKKALTKYIPDVSNALAIVMEKIKDKLELKSSQSSTLLGVGSPPTIASANPYQSICSTRKLHDMMSMLESDHRNEVESINVRSNGSNVPKKKLKTSHQSNYGNEDMRVLYPYALEEKLMSSVHKLDGINNSTGSAGGSSSLSTSALTSQQGTSSQSMIRAILGNLSTVSVPTTDEMNVKGKHSNMARANEGGAKGLDSTQKTLVPFFLKVHNDRVRYQPALVPNITTLNDHYADVFMSPSQSSIFAIQQPPYPSSSLSKDATGHWATLKSELQAKIWVTHK